MKQNKVDLEEALFTLIDTLNDPEAREDDFQKLFEEHPDILYSLGYSEFLEEPRLHDPMADEDYYPDFVARRAHDQREEIVDLKLPDLGVKIFDKGGRRKRLSAEMQEYISQVTEYAGYFDDRTNQGWFEEEHGWGINLRPTTKIIGGGFSVNRDEVNRLLDRQDVTLSTYVDVLNTLMQQHERRYGTSHDAFAWQVVANIRLHEQEGSGDDKGRFYIFDRGHKFHRDRCSLWIDEERHVGFTAFDDERRRVELCSNEPIDSEKFGVVTVEFQASSNGCVASLLFNGRTADYYVSSETFEMDQKLLARKKYVGGNLHAEHGAYFDMGEYVEWDRILTIEERADVYAKAWSKLSHSSVDSGVRYFPDTVMSVHSGGRMKLLPGKKNGEYLGTGKENILTDFFSS